MNVGIMKCSALQNQL